MKSENQTLFVLFKLNGELYCINSEYISSIIGLPKYELTSSEEYYLTGVFYYKNKVINMLDLRKLFKMQTLNEEYLEFCHMIDERKEDHIQWVKELERCLKANEKFSLSVNPHKCKLGNWYDNFLSNNSVVMYHLKQINEPHAKLHHAAEEAMDCERICEKCKREKCLQSSLGETKEIYMPLILKLLEQAKGVFKSTIYHEKVFVLYGNNNLGIVVDEVISIKTLTKLHNQNIKGDLINSTYIKEFYTDLDRKDLILEINIPKILSL